MIAGIGIDLIEIERVRKAASKAAFLSKVFTEGELALYRERGENPAVLAGCFAAKEAVVKAMGTGFSGFGPLDIAVLRRENGAPYAVLSGRALQLSVTLGIGSFLISLTNTADTAAAVAIALRGTGL